MAGMGRDRPEYVSGGKGGKRKALALGAAAALTFGAGVLAGGSSKNLALRGSIAEGKDATLAPATADNVPDTSLPESQYDNLTRRDLRRRQATPHRHFNVPATSPVYTLDEPGQSEAIAPKQISSFYLPDQGVELVLRFKVTKPKDTIDFQFGTSKGTCATVSVSANQQRPWVNIQGQDFVQTNDVTSWNTWAGSNGFGTQVLNGVWNRNGDQLFYLYQGENWSDYKPLDVRGPSMATMLKRDKELVVTVGIHHNDVYFLMDGETRSFEDVYIRRWIDYPFKKEFIPVSGVDATGEVGGFNLGTTSYDLINPALTDILSRLNIKSTCSYTVEAVQAPTERRVLAEAQGPQVGGDQKGKAKTGKKS